MGVPPSHAPRPRTPSTTVVHGVFIGGWLGNNLTVHDGPWPSVAAKNSSSVHDSHRHDGRRSQLAPRRRAARRCACLKRATGNSCSCSLLVRAIVGSWVLVPRRAPLVRCLAPLPGPCRRHARPVLLGDQDGVPHGLVQRHCGHQHVQERRWARTHRALCAGRCSRVAPRTPLTSGRAPAARPMVSRMPAGRRPCPLVVAP